MTSIQWAHVVLAWLIALYNVVLGIYVTLLSSSNQKIIDTRLRKIRNKYNTTQEVTEEIDLDSKANHYKFLFLCYFTLTLFGSLVLWHMNNTLVEASPVTQVLALGPLLGVVVLFVIGIVLTSSLWFIHRIKRPKACVTEQIIRDIDSIPS